MMRPVVIAALVVLLAVILWIANPGCRQDYNVTVRIVATNRPDLPFAATGSVARCGWRRLIAGRTDFYLVLRPGTPSGVRTSQPGGETVAVTAWLSADSKTARYEATVLRLDSRVLLGSGRIFLPPR